MARRKAEDTLSLDVYSQLRDAILSGSITPGSKLKAGELRERYDVSLSVVREALTRLTEQRLVVAEPNLGFSVAPVSAEHLRELVEARCAIEGLTIRLSTERGDLEWESAAVAAHHRLERTPTWRDGQLNPDWVSAHAAFHAALLGGCGNDILRSTCASLFDMAELYRRWNETEHNPGRDVAQEHRDLLAAALDHNGERAEELLIAHICLTRDLAMANIPALHPHDTSPTRAAS